MTEGIQTGRRPDLFIIGGAKCGTTSLHDYLARHPDVFMADPKEPGYFVPEVDYYPKDLSWYLGLFAGAGDARVVGESSTHYSKMPVFSCPAERVADFSPGARIIYLMRDPIDRAVSHYWHNARKHHDTRPMLRAIKEDVQYRAFGSYAMQLRPWMDCFDREKILVLVFEEMVAKPEETLTRVLGWLDLPDVRVISGLEKKNARPSEVTRARGRGIVNRFRYSDGWETLSPLFPKRLRAWATRFALERVQPRDEPLDEVRSYLRPWAREGISALEELLGRDFSCWTTSLGDEK